MLACDATPSLRIVLVPLLETSPKCPRVRLSCDALMKYNPITSLKLEQLPAHHGASTPTVCRCVLSVYLWTSGSRCGVFVGVATSTRYHWDTRRSYNFGQQTADIKLTSHVNVLGIYSLLGCISMNSSATLWKHGEVHIITRIDLIYIMNLNCNTPPSKNKPLHTIFTLFFTTEILNTHTRTSCG